MSADSLSSLSVVKSRTRTLSRRVREGIERGAHSCSKRRKYSTLFPIEVVDEDSQHQVKIHYVGYSDKYDEWIRKSQIQYKPVVSNSPLSSQELNLQSHNFATLACGIKQKLVPIRKLEDPKVRIQVPFDNTSFNLLKRNGVLLDIQFNGHQVHGIKDYEDLDELFGEQWHLRIVNRNGDFSCALLKTIQFYATCPRPILDFSINTTPLLQDDELTLSPYFTVQQPTVVFQFVKKDGSKCQLINLLTEGSDAI